MKTKMLLILNLILALSFAGFSQDLASSFDHDTHKISAFDFDSFEAKAVKRAPRSYSDIASISVYSNPASQKVVVDFETSFTKNLKVVVKDTHGRKLSSKKMKSMSGKRRIAMETKDLTGGFYLLSLEGDNFKETRKFIVGR